MAQESKSSKPFFIKTFRFNEITSEELDEFHKICKRNNRTMSEEIELKIKNTVKNHTTGNSQFKIAQWFDNKDMRAVPAYNSTNETWKKYVINSNLENYTALREKHKQIGKILQQAEIETNRIFFSDNSHSQSVAQMGLSLEIIDKSCLEKSKIAYNELLHNDNMKFFKRNSKHEYLNKAGVEADQHADKL